MIILTGYEGSLGRELVRQIGQKNVWGISGEQIQAGRSAIREEMEWAQESGQEITAIINNYGINRLSHIGETPESDEMIYQANVMGPYWVVDSAVALDFPPCRVINVASATWRVAQRKTALYCASKAALVQMTKVMARELAPNGWVINAFAPGKIEDTRMSELTDQQVLDLRGWRQQDADQYALANVPMGRFTNKEEVAKAIMKVLELPEYINGTVIEMMGGV